jgi:hypothetical protein
VARRRRDDVTLLTGPIVIDPQRAADADMLDGAGGCLPGEDTQRRQLAGPWPHCSAALFSSAGHQVKFRPRMLSASDALPRDTNRRPPPAYGVGNQ